MSDATYELTVRYGSVQLGLPTDQWVQDPDGWWRQIFTDSVWFDEAGVEYRREPTEALVRMSDPPPWISQPRRSWLARLFGRHSSL